MGRIHLARQRSLGREVAIKSVREDTSASAVASLLDEARVTGTLEHPNIVPVHAIGLGPNRRPLMVMKRVEGVSWEALLADDAHPMSATLPAGDREERHLRVLMAVARAAEFAHRRGWVHRDIKPENVMIGGVGEIYLVDWGLAAKVGQDDERGVVGTPAFMAPEMVEAKPPNPRTDVYLLGATLHVILCGEPPHRGATMMEVLLEAFTAKPPSFDSEVAPELASICRRALSREPAERYAYAGEFRVANLVPGPCRLVVTVHEVDPFPLREGHGKLSGWESVETEAVAGAVVTVPVTLFE